MKLIHCLLGLLCALWLPFAAHAQAGYGFGYQPTSLAVLKAQPLVVLLEEEDPKQVRKLADKPDDLAQYRAYIAFYNNQLRELAPKFWHFSPAVEFKLKSEMEALRKAKGPMTVVLLRTEDKTSTFGMGRASNGYNGALRATATVAEMCLLVVGDGKIDYRDRAGLAPGPAYASDIVFALRDIQRSLQHEADGYSYGKLTKQQKEAERTKSAAQVRSKTLLLDPNQLDPKLTEAIIREVYPYPFQLAPRATIEAAVLSADIRYTYVRWLTFSAEQIGQVVLDAADSEVLRFLESTGGFGRSSLAADMLDKADLKRLAASVADKADAKK